MILSAQTTSFNQKIIFYLNIIITLFITFIILTLAKKLTKKLGTVGLRIIERIMGMILMVIAIQFIIGKLNMLFIFTNLFPMIIKLFLLEEIIETLFILMNPQKNSL